MAGILCESFGAYGDFDDFKSVHGTAAHVGTPTFPNGGRHDAGKPVLQGGAGIFTSLTTFPAPPLGTDFYFHFAYKPDVDVDAGEFQFCEFREIGPNKVHIALRRELDDTIRIYKRTTLLESATISNVLVNGSWHIIEGKLNIHDTTGTWLIKVNGVTVLSGSAADTRDAGTGVVDSIRLMCNSSSNSTSFADVVLWNDTAGGPTGFQGEQQVTHHTPTGAGNSAQFTVVGASTNWEALDNRPTPNVLGSDYIESNTVGHKDTVAMDDTTLTDDPLFVRARYAALKNGAGARSVQSVLRSSGGTEATGAANSLGTGLAYFADVFDVEPGGAAWTTAKIDGAEAGLTVQA